MNNEKLKELNGLFVSDKLETNTSVSIQGHATRNKPRPHYNGYAVLEFIQKQGLDFTEGNVVKYVCRFKKKNGLEDLRKAQDYLQKLIEFHYPGQ